MLLGAEGLTLYRSDDRRWRLNCSGGYVDADESDFEVIAPALEPRAFVLPSLNGGWLALHPLHHCSLKNIDHTGVSAEERWGRIPEPDDFFGRLELAVANNVVGFPVLWDRDRQLKLIYFLEQPDRATSTFPQRFSLEWPDPELLINGVVTIDPGRFTYGDKVADLDVTLRNPIGDRAKASGHLVVPADICMRASKWLVDLFPAVTADDLDFI